MTKVKSVVILLVALLLLTGVTALWLYQNSQAEKVPAGAKQVGLDYGISFLIADTIAVGQIFYQY